MCQFDTYSYNVNAEKMMKAETSENFRVAEASVKGCDIKAYLYMSIKVTWQLQRCNLKCTLCYLDIDLFPELENYFYQCATNKSYL